MVFTSLPSEATNSSATFNICTPTCETTGKILQSLSQRASCFTASLVSDQANVSGSVGYVGSGRTTGADKHLTSCVHLELPGGWSLAGSLAPHHPPACSGREGGRRRTAVSGLRLASSPTAVCRRVLACPTSYVTERKTRTMQKPCLHCKSNRSGHSHRGILTAAFSQNSQQQAQSDRKAPGRRVRRGRRRGAVKLVSLPSHQKLTRHCLPGSIRVGGATRVSPGATTN